MVCESFQCLPHEAVRALENDPDHLIPKILSARAFSLAMHEYQRDGDKNAYKNPMILTVRDCDFDRVEQVGKGDDES